MEHNKYVHRVQCAAIARGCRNSLTWQSQARAYPTEESIRLLELNGWRLDQGLWICGNHD